jgi:hypothetical protein
MTTKSFDFEWISASAGDGARSAAVTTRPSTSVNLKSLFMVFLLRYPVLIHTSCHVQTVKVMPYKRGAPPIDFKSLLIRHKNLQIPLVAVSSYCRNMTTRKEPITTIAIIGGGVSGTLTAFYLVRQGTPARVILIDKQHDFGLGLAYSTPSLRHLLNVPAGKISALPDQPNHFLNWLRRNHDPAATEKTFAPRSVFGRYIQSLLKSTSQLDREIATVVDVRLQGSGAVLRLDNGCELRAGLVVLATGNFDPDPLPGITKAASDSGLYRHNAWATETYDGLHPEARVALIGTGLTGVDVVLRLRELGHRGKIIALSRHGIFPNRHDDHAPLSSTAIPSDAPATCVAYLNAPLHTGARLLGS